MKEDSELEDGEIRDDVYEDISDCALSDILQEGKTLNCSNNKLNTVVTVSDFSEDNDVEQLRKEALKSLNQEDEINEEEIFRLEALKSLLKNTEFLHQNELTPESDDLTEEEQYRLEALKSLIMNTEFMPKKEISEIKTKKSEMITAVGRKRKKRKRKNNSNKHLRHDCDLPLPKKNSYLYETTSLLSGLSEDVKKINKTLESQKTEYVNKENTVKFELDGSRSSLRSWYPKTEFTLLDISSVHNIEANHTVDEVKSEAEPISIEESNVKAVEMKKIKRVRFLDEVLAEQSALNEVKEENFIEFRQKPNNLLEKPKLLPIDSKPNVFKLNKVTLPSRKILSPKPPPNFCNFRKFETFPSTVSRKFVFQKKEKYKLNNIIKSRYSLRKTVPKIDKSKLKLVNNRSRYSLNRANFPKIPPNEFLIPLENDSSTDDENVISDTIDSQVSSSVTPKTEEMVVKVKEEPKDYDELNVPCAMKIENSLKVDKILCVEPKIVQNEEISSMDNEKSEIVPLKKEIFNETNDKVEPPVKDEKDLLLEAEENLIEIRSKLLLSLNELGTSIKTNADEKEKLNNMIKKLTVLKSAVKKLEEKIKTQKMKLAMSNSITRSHYEGVTLRSITCSKMKDLCTIAGMKIIGPHYRPPIEYETQLEEKKKTVDFSRCIPKFNENK